MASGGWKLRPQTPANPLLPIEKSWLRHSYELFISILWSVAKDNEDTECMANLLHFI